MSLTRAGDAEPAVSAREPLVPVADRPPPGAVAVSGESEAVDGASGTVSPCPRIEAPYCNGAVAGCRYFDGDAESFECGLMSPSARSIVIGIGVMPCTLIGDTLLGLGDTEEADAAGKSLLGGTGGTAGTPALSTLGSSLPNKALVLGAETTRRRKRAAAELRRVPFSGDFFG